MRIYTHRDTEFGSCLCLTVSLFMSLSPSLSHLEQQISLFSREELRNVLTKTSFGVDQNNEILKRSTLKQNSCYFRVHGPIGQNVYITTVSYCKASSNALARNIHFTCTRSFHTFAAASYLVDSKLGLNLECWQKNSRCGFLVSESHKFWSKMKHTIFLRNSLRFRITKLVSVVVFVIVTRLQGVSLTHQIFAVCFLAPWQTSEQISNSVSSVPSMKKLSVF